MLFFLEETTVVNGEFTILFMVPKDINYRYGDGRIVYYAVDETLNREAKWLFGRFNCRWFKVMISQQIKKDLLSECILIHRIFLSGQTVNNSPVFYAFMNDDFGINTVGAGIGQ